MGEAELEVKVYEWFDGHDLRALPVVQRIFPGKEMIHETLRILNKGEGRALTRGHLVAAMSETTLAPDLIDLLRRVGGTGFRTTPPVSQHASSGPAQIYPLGGRQKAPRKVTVGRAARAPNKPPIKPRVDGQAGQTEGLSLNENEAKLLRCFIAAGGQLHLRTVSESCFENLDREKAYSWARNSIRKLVENGLASKVDRGEYKVTPKGQAWR